MTFDLLRWAADYYHHPLGEVMAAALPASLRAGQAARAPVEVWSLTSAGRSELERPAARRAPKRRALLARLAERDGTPADDLAGFKPALLRALAEDGWAVPRELPAAPMAVEARPSEFVLTAAQAGVIEAIRPSLGRFAAHLLYGVTGSGKTEVYLQVIDRALGAGGQVLVLVPEIALTPQLVERFQRRFSAGVVAVHSGLTGAQRRDAWRAAHAVQARIVIGTRSAVFTPLERLSLIVVDEEHDASYKQQEGFRYSARDLAVLRAQRAQVPVVLGSATPSLETLDNVAQGRYSRHVAAAARRARRSRRAMTWSICASIPAIRGCRSRRSGDRSASGGRRAGDRVPEPARLRADLVLQCLRLGRAAARTAMRA